MIPHMPSMLNSPKSQKPAANDDRSQLVARLSASKLFKDYQSAFQTATGLPLTFTPPAAPAGTPHSGAGSPFCALLARSQKTCAACLRLQQDLEAAGMEDHATMSCFAGLSDSVVPVRSGESLLGFLKTGQVLSRNPDSQDFAKVVDLVRSWDPRINLLTLEEAFFSTRVLDNRQYSATVKLLSTFAEHLATISNSVAFEQEAAEPELVTRARKFIGERYAQPLSLEEAATAVNASTRQFCKVFKQTTGMTFTEYLARVRVEKARTLLCNPHLRISEIAFDTGFESISQFNRTFKRITGKTPSNYRQDTRLRRSVGGRVPWAEGGA